MIRRRFHPAWASQAAASAGAPDTPIDFTGVTASRSSGIAPLAVFFNALSVTTPETALPFHECLFRWDFGDPAGGAVWGFGSRADLSKNAATGAMAAHVFETPGSYLVALTVFDGVNIEEYTIPITVTDPATVYSQRHFYSNDTTYAVGTPAHNGTTVFRHDSTSDLDVAIATDIGTNRALYFEWGDTFTASETYEVEVDGPGVIGANPYGSGTRPIFSGSNTLGLSTNTNHDFGDWRFVDIDFASAADAGTLVAPAGGAANLLFLRCKVRDFAAPFNLQIGTLDTINGTPGTVELWNGWVIAGCEFSSNDEYGFLGSIRDSAFLGNSFGPVVDALVHVVRVVNGKRLVVSANLFDATGGPGTPLTMRSTADYAAGTATLGTNYESSHYIVSDNKIVGGTASSAITFDVPGGADQRIADVICERNWLVASASAIATIITQARYCSVRNNLTDNSARVAAVAGAINCTKDAGTPAGFQTNVYITHNTAFTSATQVGGTYVSIGSSSGSPTAVFARNNLAYAPLYTPGSVWCLQAPGGGAPWGSNAPNPSGNTANEVAADGVNDTPTFVDIAPTDPADFMLDTGSYAIGAGTDGLKVFDDFFGGIRGNVAATLATPNTDIGFHAKTAGALP